MLPALPNGFDQTTNAAPKRLENQIISRLTLPDSTLVIEILFNSTQRL